jgi:hypothetical protein
VIIWGIEFVFNKYPRDCFLPFKVNVYVCLWVITIVLISSVNILILSQFLGSKVDEDITVIYFFNSVTRSINGQVYLPIFCSSKSIGYFPSLNITYLALRGLFFFSEPLIDSILDYLTYQRLMSICYSMLTSIPLVTFIV